MALVAAAGNPAFAGMPKLMLRHLPVVKRQAEVPGGEAGAGTAIPTGLPGGTGLAGTGAVAGTGINSEAASSYLANNGIPPAILSDPAVQSAISSVALQQGIPVSQISDSISSLNSQAATATDSTSKGGKDDPASTSSDASESGETSGAGASKTDTETDSTTSTKTKTGAHSTITSGTGSTGHGIDDGDDDDGFGTSASASGSGAGFKLSVKAGWLTIATLGAVFFVLEGI